MRRSIDSIGAPPVVIAQICDMVAVARLLNLTLIVPELDKTSFWNDPRYMKWPAFLRIKLLNVFLAVPISTPTAL
jgi:hypothetical protein